MDHRDRNIEERLSRYRHPGNGCLLVYLRIWWVQKLTHHPREHELGGEDRLSWKVQREVNVRRSKGVESAEANEVEMVQDRVACRVEV